MRKKTLTTHEILKVKALRNTFLDEENKVSENSSEQKDDSDDSIMEYRKNNKQRVVLTKEELEDLNVELRRTGIEPVDMSQLGRMTHKDADVLRQMSKKGELITSDKRLHEDDFAYEQILDKDLLSSGEQEIEFQDERKPMNSHRGALKKNIFNMIEENVDESNTDQIQINQSNNKVKK